MLTIAVLASGRGSNFRAILESIQAGRIAARVALVLSNVPDAPVLDYARAAGIPVWAASHKGYPDRAAFDAAMLAAMQEHGAEAVVLAGYMRLLSTDFIRAYAGKIINIHPSLLPAFPGAHGSADALAYGVKLAGCTVHFVEEALDAGPVVVQAALPVLPDETTASLIARVHTLEHRIYPQAVAWLAAGRLRVAGRTVHLAPAAATPVPGAATNAGHAFPCLIQPPLEEGF